MGKSLLDKVRENEDDETALRNAELMFDTAALRSDYKIADDVAFADRILSIMYENLGVSSDSTIDEEPEDIDEEDEPADEEDADDDDDEVEYEEADEEEPEEAKDEDTFE